MFEPISFLTGYGLNSRGDNVIDFGVANFLENSNPEFKHATEVITSKHEHPEL